MKKMVFLFMFSILFIFSIKNEAQQFQKLEQAYNSGQITANEMILNKFYYIYDRKKVNRTLISDISKPVKCATPFILEYRRLKNSLSKSTIDIIENYSTMDAALYYISSGGHFKLTYTITGDDAVSSADDNNNGTPDYVEWAAQYLETSWNVEITQCGFRGPVDTQGDGYYNVYFEDLGTAYGYTYDGLYHGKSVDGNEGSYLVLNRNYNGFPANQDITDGSQKGALKVTCAHEFRHASQYKYTPWQNIGSDWVELDAAWAEELVFDYVNDTMLHFTGPGTGDPFSRPDLPLDEEVSPGKYFYGKYFWEDFLHQKFDNNSYTSAPIILAFWQRRANYQSENVLDTYDYVLQQFGSSLSEAFTEYTVWNYYTGNRAVPGFGYDEAGVTGFPQITPTAVISGYPASGLNFYNHLACDYIRLNPGGQSALKTSFNGYNSFQTNAVVTWTNGSSVTWEKIRLDNSNDGIIGNATRNYGALITVGTAKTGYDNYYNYSYNITSASTYSISFTNKNGTANLGDYLWIDGNVQIPSGTSRSLIEYSNRNVKTNKERFQDLNYKHHDWNNDFTLSKLSRDFQVRQDQNQTAYFQTMNPATIKNLLEGTLYNLGNINFNDPWYVDQSGSQPNTYQSFASPYSPKGKYGETGGGVFLSQRPDYEGIYYSVRAPLTQDIYLSQTGKTHKFYFQNWSTTGATTQQVGSSPSGYDQKAVVFSSSSAVVNANYKGTQLSSEASAFTNNSQRKLVRTCDVPTAWLHQVYESMGHVWLEHSTDNGSTWFLGNNNQPLDNGAGKCPSIDWHYYAAGPGYPERQSIVIVFQQRIGSTNQYTIENRTFQYSGGSYVLMSQNCLYTEPSGGDQYASVNANPNITWGSPYGPYYFVLTFERKSTAGSMQPGIYWIYGYMYEEGVSISPAPPTSPVKITGTNSSSINAAVSLNKNLLSPAVYSNFNIVYQQGTNSIYNVALSCVLNGSVLVPSQLASTVISSPTGYLNYQPSMVQMPDGSIRVCWIRDFYGAGSSTPYNVNTVYWNSASSLYTYAGNMVNSVSLNIRDGNTNTYYAYAQNTNNTTWQNFASNNSSTTTLGTAGRYIQLSNGSSSANMYASAFILQSVHITSLPQAHLAHLLNHRMGRIPLEEALRL